MRLNLGCGDNRLPAPWRNHDADVDITKPLPWPDNSAQFIVIEHCVEHVTYYEAIEFFKEAFRVLKIGGVLRVTVPSLTQVMNCRDQTYFDWLKEKGWAPTADDRGAMHAMLYCHGHKTAWNALLMEATLYYAGFNSPRKQKLGWSSHPDLCDVEGHARVIGERFNNVESITFEAAKQTGDLAKDYDAGFYAMHVPWREEYGNIAQAIVDCLPPFETAVDFGCGNGYVIESLASCGKSVIGYDGSENAFKHNPKLINIADITKKMNVLPHDLVICTEVAEHIDEQYADVLVGNLCRAARHTIFFSAAQAGHGGHLHVNEQPREYWCKKFEARGFHVDPVMTRNIAAQLLESNKKTWWFAQNCFVLRKHDQAQLDLGDNAAAFATRMRREYTDAHPELKQGRHTEPRHKVAIVLGGSERVWDDVQQANIFCGKNNLEPVYYATNDMIEQFPLPIVAVTLHPDKLRMWLNIRHIADRQPPEEVWSHDGGSRADHAHVTHRLKDWGGSVGMFAYVVAREHGHDRVILCGVPMTSDNHFVRKSKWSAVSAFTRAWEARKTEMAPYVRSLSGGWTEQLFGVPDKEWLQSSPLEIVK